MADIKKDANEKIKKAEDKENLKKNSAELNDDDMDKVAGGFAGQNRMEYVENKMKNF